MTFNIFHKTGELHFDRDGIDDYDGDDGEYIEIDIPDREIRDDVVAFICHDYFRKEIGTMSPEMKESFIRGIAYFLSDNELWGNMTENYYDKLQAKYERDQRR